MSDTMEVPEENNQLENDVDELNFLKIPEMNTKEGNNEYHRHYSDPGEHVRIRKTSVGRSRKLSRSFGGFRNDKPHRRVSSPEYRACK